jgi:hypothetical protein
LLDKESIEEEELVLICGSQCTSASPQLQYSRAIQSLLPGDYKVEANPGIVVISGCIIGLELASLIKDGPQWEYS